MNRARRPLIPPFPRPPARCRSPRKPIRLVLPFLVALPLLLFRPPAAAGDPIPHDPVLDAARADLRRHPADPEAYRRVADAARRLDTIDSRRLADETYREAIRRWPHAADFLVDYAELRVHQRFFGEARRLYRKATRADPTSIVARYGLARLALFDYRRGLDKRSLVSASFELDRLLKLDPDHRDGLLLAGFCRMMMGDSAAAAVHVHELVRRHPDDPRGHLMQMSLALDGRRYGEADSCGARAEACLAAWPDREAFHMLEQLDWRIEDDRLELAGAARSGLERGFWKRRDPTPATDRNERLLEHMRRVLLADLMYGLPETGLRGWETAPGEAIIRFGPPVARMVDLGGGVQIMYMFRASRLYQTHSFENESLTLVFDDMNLNGFWVEPYDWGRPSTMDNVAALIEASSPLPVRGPPIDYALDAVQFREPGGGTRLEMIMAVPDAPDSAASWLRPVGIYDSGWNRIGEVNGRMDRAVRVPDREHPEANWLVDLLPFSMPAPADTVYLGSQLEAEHDGGFGGRLDRLQVRRFPADSLCMSDILLLDRLEFDAAPGPFTRRDGRAIPHPTGIYAAGETVPVYFELYNLAPDDLGQGHYLVEVEVNDLERASRWVSERRESPAERRRRDRPRATIRFEESTAGRIAERMIDLSVGRLPTGDYSLKIRVLDLVGGLSTASEAVFRVVQPRGVPAGDHGRREAGSR